MHTQLAITCGLVQRGCWRLLTTPRSVQVLRRRCVLPRPGGVLQHLPERLQVGTHAAGLSTALMYTRWQGLVQGG